ncbi:MAG: response regulator, partial [Thermoplasmatales archaeon]|nr:response regulator [Thermoplasmatales archaeon]
FEPFYSKTPQGTGLGLAIVSNIIEKNDGNIHIESTPNVGTIFKMLFPAVIAEKSEKMTAAVDKNTYIGTERVLFVEDNLEISRIMERTLKKYGYEVITALNGDEALKKIENFNRKIDIIVTDIIMPGQYSGIQLVEDLRKKMPAVKVLYISGYTADNVIADDENFLSKPFGVKELLGEVRKILEQN